MAGLDTSQIDSARMGVPRDGEPPGRALPQMAAAAAEMGEEED
jgi:hypothetical protein